MSKKSITFATNILYVRNMFTRYVHRILLIALVLTGAGASYVRAQSGNCGDRILSNGKIVSDSSNVTWTLYSDSLAFVGIGAMGTTASGANGQANYIKKVSFSKDITFIGRYTLSQMTKLEKITVDPENANYFSPEGSNCLIERANENDTNILLFIGNGFIPEGVEVLRNYALCDNYRMTSITIPRSVKQMGEKTPHQDVGYNESPIRLPSLTEIHVQWTTEEELPEWLADKFILNANKITLYVPCGTKSIYQNAAPWNTCKKIVDGSGTCGTNLTWEICDSVLTISGTGEMTNWVSNASVPWSGYRNEIKHVVIEEGVRTIGDYAFHQMSKIKTVTNPSTLEKIGTFAFHSCYNLESINLPNGLTHIGRNTTGHGPFYGCHSLKTLYIPASVTMINKDAFLRCHSLTSIIVDPANTKYDSRNNCNAIIETATNKLLYGCSISVIPDGVVTVSDFAFEYQHNLKSIRISNTVTSFGTMVFKECENLKDIYVEWTENIPNYQLTAWYEHSKANIGIDLDTTITVHVPCGCAGLYQSLSNWKKYKIVDDHKKGGICGANGSNLTWMLDCSDVLTISGTGEMAGWANTYDIPWDVYRPSITSVVIEDGVTSIGMGAFYWCTALTSVTIPSSVTSIGYCAFYQCSSLASVTIPEGVVSIGQSAFRVCSLTSVTIPNSVTTISNYAFYDCIPLTDMYVSWTENIPFLLGAITNKTPQSDITLHVPCCALSAYQAANRWKNYTIETEFTASGTCGAAGDNLTWTLCDSVLTISGTGEMKDYSSASAQPWTAYQTAVKSVVIEDGVTTIGKYAFASFSNLTSVTIASSVTSIGVRAFGNCDNLKSVTIPSSVATLGENMFYSSGVTDFYLEWTVSIPTWPSNFTNNKSAMLHVPCEAIDLYKATAGWKDYSKIEGDDVTYTVTVQTATGDVTMGTVSIVVN